MVKINKIEYNNILSYKEFIMKYGNELQNQYEKGEISQEIIDNLVITAIEYNEFIKDYYVEIIKQIYIAIIESKYIDYPKGYLESIYKLTRYISYLNTDWNIVYNNGFIDLDQLCNRAYKELYRNGKGDGMYMKEEMEEEFKPIHLLDLDYQLNNLKKYTSNEKFIKELDKDEWRHI